ncbi:TPA: hypothetical protein DCR49_11570 [Candidatus Delongbacteria bacterium]|nr:MAG: hypothetical protein A2Y39_05655 [Candidatus Delongbacteria bacterium GWF2_40_14]HAQ62612.1 hypothetical protein [Candidatus Delongbacteria bacterium]
MKGRVNYSIFLTVITLSIVLLIYFSYYFIIETRSRIVERELLFNDFAVKNSIQNIESVIEMLSKHLQLEAEHHSQYSLDEDSRRKIENSLMLHKPFISSVTRTDRNGIIVFTVPDNQNSVGRDISYQSHVKKIMTDHEPVFSDVFMAVQGYYGIGLHMPVMKNGDYDGSLAYLISFDHLTDFLREKFRSSGEKNIQWILSNSGNILYSNNKNETGKNVSDDIRKINPVSVFFEKFLAGEIKERFSFDYNGEKYYGDFKKIRLTFGESWNVFSAVSESSIFRKNSYLPIKFLMLSLLTICVLLLILHRFRTMTIIIKEKEINDYLQKNLEVSQKLYKTVLTDMTCMVCRLNGSKKIIFFNRPFYQKFRYRTNKLKNRDIVEIFSEEEAIVLNTKLDELSQSNPVQGFEFLIKINGSDVFYYLTVRASFDETGKITEYQLIGPDITEYKMSERKDIIYREKIKESEKMAALGNLAAGVAHDFNNILMGIQGNISMLKLKNEKNEEITTRISVVEEQIKNASGLSRQLLGMAKAGKYEVTKFDPNELVRSIYELFSHTNKNIVFKLELSSSENLAVEGDKSQISQAVTNIILNAIQAIEDTGIIEIRTEFFDPDEEFIMTNSLKKQKYYKCSVKDNGTGIDEELKMKIFDPFFTTRKKGKGSGLGLASAYGIVRNHEGILLFQSEKFIGSTFSIYLPVKEWEGKSSGEASVSGRIPNNETVLIVDDEKMVLNATSDMLSYLGYKTLKAENGKIAIDIFKNNPDIKCVILDMIMPGMDGEKVFLELKKLQPEIKAIISSGYSMSSKVEALLMNGAKGFLEKPFSMEELSEKMKEVLTK